MIPKPAIYEAGRRLHMTKGAIAGLLGSVASVG
jgi:hypothetical protein